MDVADRWMCNRLDFEVLKCLAQHPDVPAILVLNKVFFPRVVYTGYTVIRHPSHQQNSSVWKLIDSLINAW